MKIPVASDVHLDSDTSKSCSVKGQQKVFFLQLNQVASCCRSYPIDLVEQSIDYYIDLWQQESKQLDQGIELPACQYCWQEEHNGQPSYRQSMVGQKLNLIEIFVSNSCNQMCSYCSPKFSSTWENNINQMGNFVGISSSSKRNLEMAPAHHVQDHWINELKKYISQEPVTVKLLGGEPLMQRRNLQKLLELDTKQVIKLDIGTNLNPPDNKFLKWVLNNFPREKLWFTISLDTVLEHNAVPRAGFDQFKFLQNLSLLEQHKVAFNFVSVVSVLNIFSIAQFQAWLTANQYSAKFFRLNNPDCLDPSYLPDEFKQMLSTDLLPNVAHEAVVHRPNSVDLKLFEQYNYLTQYFYRTNTKITDQRLATYWNWLQQRFSK